MSVKEKEKERERQYNKPKVKSHINTTSTCWSLKLNKINPRVRIIVKKNNSCVSENSQMSK